MGDNGMDLKKRMGETKDMMEQERESKTEFVEPPEESDLFLVEEIKVEELAIDGICGVY
jgi:mycofactocin precursor